VLRRLLDKFGAAGGLDLKEAREFLDHTREDT